jgi:hypothetical protein
LVIDLHSLDAFILSIYPPFLFTSPYLKYWGHNTTKKKKVTKLPMKNNSSFTDKNCDGKFMSVISNENNDGIKKIPSA